MRARDIKTCAVVAMADAMEVGSVDDVLFDPLYQRVTGFLFEGLNVPGFVAAIPLARVAAISHDIITVPSTEEFGPASRFFELRGARSLRQARGAEVVTEAGELLGILDGFELDEEDLEVRACVLTTPLLDLHWHRQETFEPQHIRQVSSEGPILVDDEALHGSEDKDKAQQEVGTHHAIRD